MNEPQRRCRPDDAHREPHFHPDPPSDDVVDKLRTFNTLLHQYRDLA